MNVTINPQKICVSASPDHIIVTPDKPVIRPQVYSGPYEINSEADDVVLETADKMMSSNVIVHPMVAYSGSYYVSPGEEGIILQTNGMRMIADVDISAISLPYANVSLVDAVPMDVKQDKKYVNAQGQLMSGLYQWNWMGRDVEKLGQTYTEKYKLEDTGFPSWTPPTTTIIKPSTECMNLTVDMKQFDYWIRFLFRYTAAFKDGVIPKQTIQRMTTIWWLGLYRRPSGQGMVDLGRLNGNTSEKLYQSALMTYYNASGTRNLAYNASYGIYPAIVQAVFSNSYNDIVSVSVKTPNVTANCYAAWFDASKVQDIDAEKSEIELTVDAYKVPTYSMLRQMWEDTTNKQIEGW